MTRQTPINLTGSAVLIASSDINRRYMRIQNFIASAGKMYVAFGFTATAGTKGELEISPGGIEYFGNAPPGVVSTTANYHPWAPLEFISVINSGGNLTGSLMVIALGD